MDKNTAALLREDVTTIECVFHRDEAVEEHIEQHLVYPVGMDSNLVAESRRQLKISKPAAFNPRPGAKTYIYVAPIAWGIQAGDNVLAETEQGVRAIKCVRVHDRVQIEPNSAIAYKFIVGRIDLGPYKAEIEKNTHIEEAVAEAYKRRMRRSFKESVLGELEGVDRDKLAALLAAPKAADDISS